MDESFLKILCDITDEIVFVKDKKGHYIGANKTFSKKFKIPVKKLIGLTDFNIFPKEEAEMVRKTDRKVFKTRKPCVTEDYLHVNGKLRVFHTKKAPIFDKNKKLIGVCAFAKDITKQKKLEEELKKSEKRFREIVENSYEWIWEVDRNGLYTYSNKSVKRILGYSPEEIVGKKHFYDLFHPDEKKKLKKDAFKYFSKKLPFHEFINRNIHKNGKIVWLLANGIPIIDLNGKLLGYRGTDLDITKLKEVEEKLKESERKLRVMFDATHDLILLANVDGTIVDLNEAMAKSLGKKKKKLIGTNIREHLPPDVYKERTEKVKWIQKNKKPAAFEDFRNGRWFDNRFYPIFNDKGKVYQIAIFTREITDQKKMEEKLKESEEHFRLLFNTMVDPVVIVDKKGIFLDVTDRVEEVTGYKKEELIGKSFLKTDIITEKSKLILIKNLTERTLGKKVVPYEVEVLTKNGKKIPFEVNAAIINYKGKTADMVVFRDITERKKVENELKREKEKFEKYLNVVGNAIVALDTNGKITLINKSGCKILGYKEGELIGKDWFETCIPKENREEMKRVFKKIISGKAKTLEHHENPVLTKNGEIRLILWYNTLLKDTNGKIIGTLSSGTDITERKKMEDELRKSKKELEEKTRNLERFNKLAVGRELKMIELKKRITELKKLKEK